MKVDVDIFRKLVDKLKKLGDKSIKLVDKQSKVLDKPQNCRKIKEAHRTENQPHVMVMSHLLWKRNNSKIVENSY